MGFIQPHEVSMVPMKRTVVITIAMLVAAAEPRAFVPRYLDPRTWTTWLTLDVTDFAWTRATCSLQCQRSDRRWCNAFRLMEHGKKCALVRMSGLYLREQSDANASLLEVYVDKEDLSKLSDDVQSFV